MKLPFSHDAFLDVFSQYNSVFWPFAAILWLLTVWIVMAWIRKGQMEGRILLTLLSLHWVWSGIVYHLIFFRQINSAAVIFGAMFIGQAFLLGWLGIKSQAMFNINSRLRSVLAIILVFYALFYPLVGIGFGLQYPRIPLFGVPCPTTILTIGILLTCSGCQRIINLVPILWAVIGGSAAFLLGIYADIALLVAGGLLVLDTLFPRALGLRGTG